MVDKFVYIANEDKELRFLKITNSGYNVWTLNLINKPIKIKISQQKRKSYNKTFGTIVKNSQVSLLILYTCFVEHMPVQTQVEV